ncbi:hypothetical protein SVIOM342S_06500 [Streptomyces violaceorubidus]
MTLRGSARSWITTSPLPPLGSGTVPPYVMGCACACPPTVSRTSQEGSGWEPRSQVSRQVPSGPHRNSRWTRETNSQSSGVGSRHTDLSLPTRSTASGSLGASAICMPAVAPVSAAVTAAMVSSSTCAPSVRRLVAAA